MQACKHEKKWISTVPSVGPREKNVFCTFLKTFFYFKKKLFCTFFVLFIVLFSYFFCTFLIFFNGLGFKPKSKSKFSPKRLDEYRSYFQYYRRILSPTIFPNFGENLLYRYRENGEFLKKSPSICNISETVGDTTMKLGRLEHTFDPHSQ